MYIHISTASDRHNSTQTPFPHNLHGMSPCNARLAAIFWMLSVGCSCLRIGWREHWLEKKKFTDKERVLRSDFSESTEPMKLVAGCFGHLWTSLIRKYGSDWMKNDVVPPIIKGDQTCAAWQYPGRHVAVMGSTIYILYKNSYLSHGDHDYHQINPNHRNLDHVSIQT